MKPSAVPLGESAELSDYCDEFEKVHQIDNVLPLFPKTDMFAYRGKRALLHLREETRNFAYSATQ